LSLKYKRLIALRFCYALLQLIVNLEIVHVAICRIK